MWLAIAFLALVSLFVPPLWIVTAFVCFMQLKSEAEKTVEKSNEEVKKELGDKYKPEAAGDAKSNGFIFLILVFIGIAIAVGLLGSFLDALPKM